MNNSNNNNNNNNFSWLPPAPPFDGVIMPYSRPPEGVDSGRWVQLDHPIHGPAVQWVWDEPGNDVSINYNITANTNNNTNNEFNQSHILWQHRQPLPPPSYNNYNKNVRMPLRARAQSKTDNDNNINILPSYYQQYNSPSIYNPLPRRKHSIRMDFPPDYNNKSRKGKKRKPKSKRRKPSKRTTKKRKTKNKRRK